MKTKEFLNRYGIILLIILLQVANIVFWGSMKKGFFGDELYSYAFVCETEYPSINADRGDEKFLGNWHDSDYFRDYFEVSEDEKFDLAGTYESITHDVHPPVYYLLLHIACSLHSGSFSKWTGIALNIVFFILTIISLYALVCKLTNDNIIRYAVPLLYGFGVGAVDSAILARMYMALTFATVLFCYVQVKWYKSVSLAGCAADATVAAGSGFDRHSGGTAGLGNDRKRCLIYLQLILSTTLGFMTQYYFVIFAFFLCFTFWLLLIIKKKFRPVIEYTVTMFIGIGLGCLIWPAMFSQIFGGYRGEEAFENMESGGSNLIAFLKMMGSEIFGHLIITTLLALIPVVIAAWVLLSRKLSASSLLKKCSAYLCAGPMLGLFVATAGDILIISKISPYIVNRYMLNVYPLIVLILVINLVTAIRIIANLKAGKKLVIAACCLMLVSVMAGYLTIGVKYLYRETAERLKLSRKYSDCPVVLVLNKNARYSVTCASFLLRDGQNVYPIKSEGISTLPEALQQVDYHGEFIVYLDRSLENADAALAEVISVTGSATSKFLYNSTRMKVYLITT